jgi:hypothetical protein
MRKIILLMFLFLLLAACAAPEAAEPDDQPEQETPEPTAVSVDNKVDSQAVEVADPVTPAQTAAAAGVIRDRDWTLGAEDPLITIIEYGDFQ